MPVNGGGFRQSVLEQNADLFALAGANHRCRIAAIETPGRGWASFHQADRCRCRCQHVIVGASGILPCRQRRHHGTGSRCHRSSHRPQKSAAVKCHSAESFECQADSMPDPDKKKPAVRAAWQGQTLIKISSGCDSVLPRCRNSDSVTTGIPSAQSVLPPVASSAADPASVRP